MLKSTCIRSPKRYVVWCSQLAKGFFSELRCYGYEQYIGLWVSVLKGIQSNYI